MKRIAKGYYAAAGLLILWAAADFYHYAAVGRDLLLTYDGVGAVQRLVWDVRFQGGGQAAAGGAGPARWLAAAGTGRKAAPLPHGRLPPPGGRHFGRLLRHNA